MKLDKLGLDAHKAFAGSRVLKCCIYFQEQVNAIVLKGYPGGRWPEHMEPLPHIYRALGVMYRNLQYAVGLEFVLKGTLYVRDKTDPNWVADMWDLVQFLFFMTRAGDNDINWLAAEDKSLIERLDMRNVARGYMIILCMRGKFMFGMDTCFVQALYRWADGLFDIPGDSKARSDEFREAFDKSQKSLLKWANVTPDHGLVLPASNDIDKLKQDSQALTSSDQLGEALSAIQLNDKVGDGVSGG